MTEGQPMTPTGHEVKPPQTYASAKEPPIPPSDERDTLDWWKDVTSVIQAVAATLAILGAGWWFLMKASSARMPT
jgi:hypothetical protein